MSNRRERIEPMPRIIEQKQDMHSFIHHWIATPLWFVAELSAYGFQKASNNARTVADRLADFHDSTAYDG